MGAKGPERPGFTGCQVIELERAWVISLGRRPQRWQDFRRHLCEEVGWRMPLNRLDAVDTAGWEQFDGLVSPYQGELLAQDFRIKHEDISRGAVGCTLSHLTLWGRLAAHPGWQHMLIFEDDARWSPPRLQAADEIGRRIDALPADWDLAMLGCNPRIVRHRRHDYLELASFFLTHAYVIHRRALDRLLPGLLPLNEQLDAFISRRIQDDGLRAYTLLPAPFWQARNESDVQKPLSLSPERSP